MSTSSLDERTGYDHAKWARELGAPVAVTQYRDRFVSYLIQDGSVRVSYDLGRYGLHVTTYAVSMPRAAAVELMEGQLAKLMLAMPGERAPRPGGDQEPEAMEVNGGTQLVYVSRFVAHRFYNVALTMTGKCLLAPGRTVTVIGAEPEMTDVALFDMYA